jgi:hypothetical protein
MFDWSTDNGKLTLDGPAGLIGLNVTAEETAALGALKLVLHSTVDGMPLYLLPDMDHGMNDSVWAPFFGTPVATLREMVYLEGMPLSAIDAAASPKQIYAVHADHLNRPVMLTNAAKATVWSAIYEPFGRVHSVTGTVTQICVEETARQAFHHGYRTTMVADAVSSYAPDLHAATLKNFAHKFGWVADGATVMRLLG